MLGHLKKKKKVNKKEKETKEKSLAILLVSFLLSRVIVLKSCLYTSPQRSSLWNEYTTAKKPLFILISIFSCKKG